METGLETTEAVLRDEAAQCSAVSFAEMGRGSWATRLYPKTGQPVYTRYRGAAFARAHMAQPPVQIFQRFVTHSWTL